MLSHPLPQVLIALGLLLGNAQAASGASAPLKTHTISVAASSPTGAVTVPKDFVGFGFEGQFLDTYNNELSENLVTSVANRMSLPPIIRIGGTSADRITYVPTQKAAVKCIPPENDPSQCPWSSTTYSTVGPSYFDGFKAFQNARMTFQIPLNSHPNVSEAVIFAQLAYTALTPNRTAAIAIGNEVEGYDADGGNPAGYVQNASAIEKAILAQLKPKITDPAIFEVMDLSSENMDELNLGDKSFWSPAQAFGQGLDKNKTVKFAATHWYQIDGAFKGTPSLQGNLMNHNAVVQKGAAYVNATQFLQENYPHVRSVFSETGGVEGGLDFAPVFGATLWSVDWQMWAMTQGIKRIAASMRPQSHHSLWIPVANVTGSGSNYPQVRAPYYAQPFIADFIGKSADATSITENLGQQHYTAYAAYEAGNLARVALVNLIEWSPQNATTRPNMTFAIPMPSTVTTVQVARLTAADGAWAGGLDYNKQNITYAGQYWSVANNGRAHPAKPTLETIAVQNKQLQITVLASEAVLIHV